MSRYSKPDFSKMEDSEEFRILVIGGGTSVLAIAQGLQQVGLPKMNTAM